MDPFTELGILCGKRKFDDAISFLRGLEKHISKQDFNMCVAVIKGACHGSGIHTYDKQLEELRK